MSETLDRLQSALGDRYAVQRELGRGGMATVFLATDLKHGREVAIKVLHPDLAASMGAERFDREIHIAAKLQHPNILALFDSGVADGLFYYVMPFVYGESLRDRLDRDRLLPIDEALHIAIEVADALGYAHTLGIIHRDIKPENIMMSGGHALVTDFGIARAFSEGGGQKLTETGMAVGTPHYMSPEQAVGDQVGPTGDIYSLGCVLYEMLAGQPPFTGANARQIMARHAMEQVPSLQVVRDTVPDEVEDAVMACLAKQSADRPQTAAQFVELLGAPVGGTANRFTASRLSRQTMERRTATRTAAQAVVKKQLGIRLAALAGGVVLLAGAAALWFRRPHGGAEATAVPGLDPHHVAVLYFTDGSPDHSLGHLADGFTEALIGALSSVDRLHVISRGGSSLYRDATISRDSIARALNAGTLVVGSLEPAAGGRLRIQLRLVDGNSGVDLSDRRASLELPERELLALRDSIAEKAASLIRSQLGEEIRVRTQRESTRDEMAWSLMQQAEKEKKEGERANAAGDTVAMKQAFDRADSVAAAAEQRDPGWAAPAVLRGAMAYIRARRFQTEPAMADRFITQGLDHVNRALSLDPANPDAFEFRGILRYWRWLLTLERDPGRAKRLLEDAQADLEKATSLNRAQAGAWATLSHMYTRTKTPTDVVFAARMALEADAFLSNAVVIYRRLFTIAYDLGDYPSANSACSNGHTRFRAEPFFIQCRLMLLTMKGTDPDVPRAWRLADSVMVLLGDKASGSIQGEIVRLYVAAVVAKASISDTARRALLQDSARKVVKRALANPEMDTQGELTHNAAFVFALMGDKAAAVDHLRSWLMAEPSAREGLGEDPGWWFRSLQNDPTFAKLVATSP